MSGAGSITKLPNGEHGVWLSAGTDPDTGKRVRIFERVPGTYRAAQTRLAAMRADVDSGRYVARRAETLSAFIESWWGAKRASIAPTTQRGYRRLIDTHILPAMGGKAIQRVSGADVSAMIGKLTAREKLRTAEQLYLVAGIIFNAAVKQGTIGRSPMAGVERPRPERRELHVLSADDWGRVREYLEKRESWTLRPLALLLTTGLRRSELCGLQWGDVDFARGLLYVRRSYHSLSTSFRGYRKPKTAGSKRAIALDGHTLDMLRAHRADAVRTAEMFGRPLPDSAPLFTINADGGPISPDSLTGAWRRIAKALGLNVRLHDIRHSSATLLLAAGVPVQLVSQRLGHASAGFTLSVYAGVLPGAQHDAAEKLAALLDGGRNRHALPTPA